MSLSKPSIDVPDPPKGKAKLREIVADMTKSSELCCFTQSEIEEMLNLTYQPGDFLRTAMKIEKGKLRILIGFMLSAFMQTTEFFHEIEKAITEMFPQYHMEGSPARIVTMFMTAVSYCAERPLCQPFMGDYTASDSQFTDRKYEFDRFVRDICRDVCSRLPYDLASVLNRRFFSGMEQAENIVLQIVIFGIIIHMWQQYGIRTGWPGTKIENTTSCGTNMEVGREMLRVMGEISRLLGWCPDLTINDWEFWLRTYQGDDVFGILTNCAIRLVFMCCLERLNINFKSVQTPGSDGVGIYLMNVIGNGGYCKLVTRAFQMHHRDYPTVAPTYSQIALLNISNAIKRVSRGASPYIAYQAERIMADWLYSGRKEVFRVATGFGGLGFSFPSYMPNKNCAGVRYRELEAVPEVTKKSCEHNLRGAVDLIIAEEAEYLAAGCVMPEFRKRAIYEMAIRTFRFPSFDVPKELKEARLRAFLSNFHVPDELNPGIGATYNVQFILYCIKTIWDPVFANMKKGLATKFGDDDAINQLHRVTEGTIWQDFAAFHTFVTAVHEQKNPGLALTAERFLQIAKPMLPESGRGFNVLKTVLEVTSSFSGSSKFLNFLAQNQRSATDIKMNKRFDHKVASVNDIRDLSGCGCNAIDSWVDENMRSIMMKFSKHIAWIYFSMHCKDLAEMWAKYGMDKTRPITAWARFVRDALIILQDYRPEDLCVQGEKRRAIQLGTLEVPFSSEEVYSTNPLRPEMGIEFDSEGNIVVTHCEPILYVGSKEVPRNREIVIVRGEVEPYIPNVAPSRRTFAVNGDIWGEALKDYNIQNK